MHSTTQGAEDSGNVSIGAVTPAGKTRRISYVGSTPARAGEASYRKGTAAAKGVKDRRRSGAGALTA